MKTNLQNDMWLGRMGEKFARELLEDSGYNVEDLSNDREFQVKDIDFSAEKDGIIKYVEAKYEGEALHTANLFLEFKVDHTKDKIDGWYSKCQADTLIIVMYLGDKPNPSKVYYFIINNFKEFKEIFNLEDLAKDKSIKTALGPVNHSDRGNYQSNGYLLSYDKIKYKLGDRFSEFISIVNYDEEFSGKHWQEFYAECISRREIRKKERKNK